MGFINASDFRYKRLKRGAYSEGEKIGPIFWMSPEALNKQLGCDGEICEVSDIYQLASVFGYSVCGRHRSGVIENSDWAGPEEVRH